MLPLADNGANRTAKHILFYSILLVPVSLIPVLTGLSGAIYFMGALILGTGMLWVSHIFVRTRTMLNAKNLLRATVAYLPSLFLLIIIDLTF